MPSEIDAKISAAEEALRQFGYDPADVSAKEFYDYLTGEIFSDDHTTLRDVLGNEYIMIHKLVEISELKNRKKNRSTGNHGNAENSLLYGTSQCDGDRTRICLTQGRHVLGERQVKDAKESVLDDDPNLPEELRPRAEEIYKKYRTLAKEDLNRPLTLSKESSN